MTKESCRFNCNALTLPVENGRLREKFAWLSVYDGSTKMIKHEIWNGIIKCMKHHVRFNIWLTYTYFNIRRPMCSFAYMQVLYLRGYRLLINKAKRNVSPSWNCRINLFNCIFAREDWQNVFSWNQHATHLLHMQVYCVILKWLWGMFRTNISFCRNKLGSILYCYFCFNNLIFFNYVRVWRVKLKKLFKNFIFIDFN